MKLRHLGWIAALFTLSSSVALASSHACPYTSGGKTQYLRAQDWQAICHCPSKTSSKDASCTTATRSIGEVTVIYGTNHVVSLTSHKSGQRSLNWKPRFYVPDGKNPVSVQIDDQPGYRLTPGRGYVQSRSGTVSLGQSAWVNEILPALKAGRLLHIRYTDQFGAPKQATMSLLGLTRSVNFVDKRLGITPPKPIVAAPVNKAAPKSPVKASNCKCGDQSAKAPSIAEHAKPAVVATPAAEPVEQPKKSALRSLFE